MNAKKLAELKTLILAGIKISPKADWYKKNCENDLKTAIKEKDWCTLTSLVETFLKGEIKDQWVLEVDGGMADQVWGIKR